MYMYNVHCTLYMYVYNARRTPYAVQCTSYVVQHTCTTCNARACNVHCTAHSARRTMYNVLVISHSVRYFKRSVF